MSTSYGVLFQNQYWPALYFIDALFGIITRRAYEQSEVIIQELLAEAGVAARSLSDLSKQLGVMGGAGAAVFGDHFEAGQDVEQKHIDNIQSVFDRFFGAQRREA